MIPQLFLHMKQFSFFAIFYFLSQSVIALSVYGSPNVIRIEGPITNNTFSQVKQDLSDWKKQDPIPAGLIVLLRSPGGNGEAAIQIGRILRHHNAHIFAMDQCESACVFILAGGVVRATNGPIVGVHAGRLTLTNNQGQIVKEIDASQSLENSFKLTAFNSESHQYLNEMGIRKGLIDVMLAHQTKSTFKLSEFELLQFGVIGFDDQYLRKRGDLYQSLPKSERINRIELYNRTLSVPKYCSQAWFNNSAFVDCYKAVLFGKAP